MKNFVQNGVSINVLAPYALASGDGCLIGSLFGVASNTAAIGAPVEIYADDCVVALTCLAADTGGVGTKMYWDNTARRLTTTATSNSLVGVLTVAKANGDTTATVRLNGTSV